MSEAKTKNGYIRWTQFAGIMVTLILALVGYIYGNDRIRACEDQRIQDRVEMYQREIIQRLTRIESKMEPDNYGPAYISAQK